MQLLAVFKEDVLSELLDEIVELQRMIANQTSTTYILVNRFRRVYLSGENTGDDMVHRSMVAELALKLRMTEFATAQLLALADRLESYLPETAYALETGLITVEQAKTISQESLTLELEHCFVYEIQVLEKILACEWIPGEGPTTRINREASDGMNPARLRALTKKIRQTLRPDDAELRHKAAYEERRVELIPAEDGMAWLNLYMSSAEATAIYNGLNTASMRLRGMIRQDPEAFGYGASEESGNGRSSVLTRRSLPTISQLKLDIALDLLFRGRKSQKAIRRRHQKNSLYRRKYGFLDIRPTIQLTVPVLSLLGRVNTMAELHGYGPIDIQTATQLTAQAKSLTRVLVDPITEARLDYGRTRYRVSAELRQQLLDRDRYCRFPGCGMQAQRCDIDHTVAWEHGGETKPSNLAHLCRKHHTLKHEGRGWKVSQQKSGELLWRSLLGNWYHTQPLRT